VSTRRTVDGLTRVAAQLEQTWGIDVVRVPGWEDRGRGDLTVDGWVNHHTGPGSWSTLLRILTHGRPDLPNSLCTFAVRLDDGQVALVAAGLSWHAGAGSWLGLAGNGTVGGTEAQHPGDDTPWTDASLRSQLAINVETIREFGHHPAHVCEHAEWAPDRKIDRAQIAGPDWRDRIRQALATPEDDMTPEQEQLLRDTAGAVQQLRRRLDDGELDARIARAVRAELHPKGGPPAGDELDMLRRGVRALLDKAGITKVRV
jgi:hypothetical protein